MVLRFDVPNPQNSRNALRRKLKDDHGIDVTGSIQEADIRRIATALALAGVCSHDTICSTTQRLFHDAEDLAAHLRMSLVAISSG
ncbi:MAG: hypothetical protein HY820_04055 [Acidobacteria bacterium]|nr:hypothetical protein [Acidobacteriota bacterium]